MYMNNIRVATIPSAVLISDAKHEICRMGDFSLKALRLSLESFFEKNDIKAEQVIELEETVDCLNREITEGLVKYRSHNMSVAETQRISMMTLVAADLERISDHAKEFALFESKLQQDIARISEDGLSDLRRFSEMTMEAVTYCLNIFATEEFDRVAEAEHLCAVIDDMQVELTNRHVERLAQMSCDPAGGVVFTDMLTGLERCAAHAINVACALTDNPLDN